jgi:hypothetical protein
MQSHSLQVSKKDKRPPDQFLPIQARLVIAPMINPPEPPIEAEESREVVPKEIVAAEIPVVEEQPVNSKASAQPADQQVETLPPVHTLPPKQVLQKNYSVIDYSNAPDVAQQQLSGLNQSKLHAMAQQAAREYQQQKNAPILELKPADPFVTEDEKLRKSVQVNVNCDGYTNTAASMLSGLFGGTLKCTKGPKVDAFIRNRLNKTELIGAPKDP